MNNNIINFYLKANNLKNVIRTGWKEVGISSERIESVAEHVFGKMVLAMALESENNLSLDMNKVFKMLVISELEKINLDKEYTPTNNVSVEDRKAKAIEVVSNITDGLIKQEEMISLLNEYYAKETNEAKFSNNVGKIESDLQAKIYDLNGQFSLENALEDAKNYGEELSSEIIPKIKNASDGWIEYDRRYYADDKMFEDLSKDIQKLQ